jgi:hypothetical protein
MVTQLDAVLQYVYVSDQHTYRTHFHILSHNNPYILAYKQ